MRGALNLRFPVEYAPDFNKWLELNKRSGMKGLTLGQLLNKLKVPNYENKYGHVLDYSVSSISIGINKYTPDSFYEIEIIYEAVKDER